VTKRARTNGNGHGEGRVSRGFDAPAHVLITGAAGAIGSALARQMRATWPETRLALLDRDAASMTALANEIGNATTHGVDLRDLSALPATIARIEGRELTSRDSVTRDSTTRDAKASDSATRDSMARDAKARDSATRDSATRDSATRDAKARDSATRDSATREARDSATRAAGGIPLDGLVNCAGVMWVRHVGSWDWDDAEALLAIDFLAPLRLQDLVVHSMLERGARGVIVNLSSMAGRVPLKGCAYYGASKAGLAMASEIARAELAPHGIRVVTVYPGPVKSNLEQGARDAFGGGGMFGRYAPVGDPDELARLIGRAIESDEARVIYPRLYRVGWSATNAASWFSLAYGPPPPVA
jgi:short-subunit dehydrogenase